MLRKKLFEKKVFSQIFPLKHVEHRFDNHAKNFQTKVVIYFAHIQKVLTRKMQCRNIHPNFFVEKADSVSLELANTPWTVLKNW